MFIYIFAAGLLADAHN